MQIIEIYFSWQLFTSTITQNIHHLLKRITIMFYHFLNQYILQPHGNLKHNMFEALI